MLSEYEAEGYRAFQRGETRNLNPYEAGSKQGRDWDAGFRLAQDREQKTDLPELDRFFV